MGCLASVHVTRGRWQMNRAEQRSVCNNVTELFSGSPSGGDYGKHVTSEGKAAKTSLGRCLPANSFWLESTCDSVGRAGGLEAIAWYSFIYIRVFIENSNYIIYKEISRQLLHCYCPIRQANMECIRAGGSKKPHLRFEFTAYRKNSKLDTPYDTNLI